MRQQYKQIDDYGHGTSKFGGIRQNRGSGGSQLSIFSTMVS